MTDIKITDSLIKEYIVKFEGKYGNDDEAISQLVNKHNMNDEPELVFAKVCAINLLYATRIRKDQIVKVAKHIYENNATIDKCLKNGDIEAFNCIRNTPEGVHNVPVFASKYCHFHNPKCFPIFDSYSRAALATLNKNADEKFYKEVSVEALSDYDIYKECINAFMKKNKSMKQVLKKLIRSMNIKKQMNFCGCMERS